MTITINLDNLDKSNCKIINSESKKHIYKNKNIYELGLANYLLNREYHLIKLIKDPNAKEGIDFIFQYDEGITKAMKKWRREQTKTKKEADDIDINGLCEGIEPKQPKRKSTLKQQRENMENATIDKK